jgi:hypothetical protein
VLKLKKKRLVIALIAIAAAVGITTGVVFAQDEPDEDVTEPETLLERACEIYEDNTGVAVDPEAFKDALIEANQDMMAEAMESRLDKLVEEGLITQEEADQFKEWWEAKPDMSLPAGGGPMSRGGLGGRFGSGPGGFGSPQQGQFVVPDDATETSSTY